MDEEKPAAPKRRQIVVKVLPETKAAFAASGIPMTKLVEQGAAYFENTTLGMLTAEEREAYLARRLTLRDMGREVVKARHAEYERANPRLAAYVKSPFPPWKRDPTAPHVVMSMLVTEEAKLQLERYSAFYKMPLPDILGIMGRRLKKMIDDRLRGREEPPVPPPPQPEPEKQPLPAMAGVSEGLT